MAKNGGQPPKCHLCNQPSTGYSSPPMCEKHETLAQMITYLEVEEDADRVSVTDLLCLLDQADNLIIDRYDVMDLAPAMLTGVRA